MVEFLIKGSISFLIGAKRGSVKKTRNLITLLVGAVNHDKIIRTNITKEYAWSKTRRILITKLPVVLNIST